MDFLELDPCNFERFKTILGEMIECESTAFRQQFESAKEEGYFHENKRKLEVRNTIEGLLAGTG